MNNERLPPDHGFPVRLIIPGHVGGRMVKWLAKVEVTEKESDNFYHQHDNKVLPPYVSFEDANVASIWKKPECIKRGKSKKRERRMKKLEGTTIVVHGVLFFHFKYARLIDVNEPKIHGKWKKRERRMKKLEGTTIVVPSSFFILLSLCLHLFIDHFCK